MPTPRFRPVLLALSLLGVSFAALAPTASATIDPSATALQIAQAMFTNPTLVSGASFVAKPASGTPDAVSDTPLAGFPTAGSDYALLTSGDANLAPTPNCCSSSGADDAGPNVRGNTDFDVTILKIDFNVQSGNCLTVGDFRFLSDEFPEYVGSSFNDAFIAELDASTWTTSGSTISAPDDFALDPSGHVISINAAGPAAMSAAEAAGTTYDGATARLTLSSPISAGPHSLYFSIFDQGDRVYDSAVIIDNIAIENVPAKDCTKGITAPPVKGSASCEAFGVRVIEKDETTGQIIGDSDARLSRSAVRADSVDGAWNSSILSSGPPIAPDAAQAHADAQQAGYHYHNTAAQLAVDASSVYSRCDASALRDPTANQLYTHAYGRGGIQDLSIKLGSTLDLHAEALDFEAMATGTSAITFGTTACEIAQLEIASPSVSQNVCTAPWTTPVSLGIPGTLHAALTFNETWGYLGANPWTYGGDVAHLCIEVNAVTRIDVYIGLVNVNVSGSGPLQLWPPMPDPCGPDAPCAPPSVGVPPACVTPDCNLPSSIAGLSCPGPTPCPPPSLGVPPLCVEVDCPAAGASSGGLPCPTPKCPPGTSGTLPDCKTKPVKCPPPTTGTLPNCSVTVDGCCPPGTTGVPPACIAITPDCGAAIADVCQTIKELVQTSAAQGISGGEPSRQA